MPYFLPLLLPTQIHGSTVSLPPPPTMPRASLATLTTGLGQASVSAAAAGGGAGGGAGGSLYTVSGPGQASTNRLDTTSLSGMGPGTATSLQQQHQVVERVPSYVHPFGPPIPMSLPTIRYPNTGQQGAPPPAPPPTLPGFGPVMPSSNSAARARSSVTAGAGGPHTVGGWGPHHHHAPPDADTIIRAYLNQLNHMHQTPLMLAAYMGRHEVVKVLLQQVGRVAG